MKLFSRIAKMVPLVAMIMVGILGPLDAVAATSPSLGAVGSYSVLGHTTVTNTGNTTMPGDLGISIGGSPTGFPPGVVGPPGAIRSAADSLAAQYADTSAFLVLNTAPNVACDGQDFGAITQDLAGLTLVPGVYCANAFHLSGALILDAQNNPDAVWIFRSELSTLTTAPGVGANVQFADGVGSPCNVWWRVASSASIGSGTSFLGNILALTSVSMGTGASLNGRILVQTGAVTLDNNTFTGAACLTPAIFVSSSATNTPLVTPRFPNAGAPDSDGTAQKMAIFVGLVVMSFLLIVTRRKKLFKD